MDEGSTQSDYFVAGLIDLDLQDLLKQHLQKKQVLFSCGHIPKGIILSHSNDLYAFPPFALDAFTGVCQFSAVSLSVD